MRFLYSLRPSFNNACLCPQRDAELTLRGRVPDYRNVKLNEQGRPMNWGWLARHTAVAIGLTFVVVAVIYLAVRLLVLGM